jgi:hypothetical protein
MEVCYLRCKGSWKLCTVVKGGFPNPRVEGAASTWHIRH